MYNNYKLNILALKGIYLTISLNLNEKFEYNKYVIFNYF